jgi:hypothetical protein
MNSTDWSGRQTNVNIILDYWQDMLNLLVSNI